MSDREHGGPEETPRRGRHRRRPDGAAPGTPHNGVPFEPRDGGPQDRWQQPHPGSPQPGGSWQPPVDGSHGDGRHVNGGPVNGNRINGSPINGSPVNGSPVNGSHMNGSVSGNGVPAMGRPLPPRVPQPATTPVAGAEEAPDLMAVQSDDALIDALSRGYGGGGGGGGEDDRIAAMLAVWKAEVDADPIPELVDTDTALATIMAVTGGPIDVDTTVFPVVRPGADLVATGPQGAVGGDGPAQDSGGTVTPMRPSRRPGKRARHLVPLAGAAALIVVAVTGVSIGAHGAQPGDALFGVTQVLYTETAQSRQAAVDAQAGIVAVKESLAAGDTSGAAQQLTTVEQLMPKVKPEDGAPVLEANQRFLTAKLQETPAGQKADPEAPLRDGTPAPEPPKIPGKPSTPTSPSAPPGGSVTSTPTAPPTTSEPPPSTTTSPTTTQSPSGTVKPTSEGQPDSSSTTSGMGSTVTSDRTPVTPPS
ncbi:anti-sigma-D factor RsdA [Pseudonocardia sp. N23]|uniref:anti-sigma-D factor RsdA n=1 Tax=Pseudonocardia sp. N23 TaxID=1987376 RepID=UPI000BFC6D3E|nr:anti-sigma-D factor RsdA [Pseudonocardia sp. N23]GAY10132.1 hypothetical protein TOK_4488 [Pseudonocardia sp. N23]